MATMEELDLRLIALEQSHEALRQQWIAYIENTLKHAMIEQERLKLEQESLLQMPDKLRRDAVALDDLYIRIERLEEQSK